MSIKTGKMAQASRVEKPAKVLHQKRQKRAEKIVRLCESQRLHEAGERECMSLSLYRADRKKP